MAHGFVNAIYDQQTGPRGDDKTFTESMFMLMAQPAGRSGNARPARQCSRSTRRMGKSGYPLLFETGETADGNDASGRPPAPARPLHGAVDASYSLQLGDDGAAFVYAGLAGRAGARAASLHAPLLGDAHPGGAAHPPLARLDAHHLRRRHRSARARGRSSSRAPGSTAASPTSTAGTSRPAASTPGRRGSPTTRCPSCRCRSATAT